jgi:hypothetical protein
MRNLYREKLDKEKANKIALYLLIVISLIAFILVLGYVGKKDFQAYEQMEQSFIEGNK